MRRTGSGQMRVGSSSSVRIVSPSGLSSSEAIFDSSLFGVTPIEQLSPVARLTLLRISCATARTPPSGSCASASCTPGTCAQVDVDLVDAAVLDQRRDFGHRRLEHLRVAPVGVEVHRQQHRIRRAQCGLHHAHGREHAQVARGIGGGGDDTAAGVVTQFGEAPGAVGLHLRLVAPPAADDHRLAQQLRVAQQLHGGVERVHVEVRDPAARRRGHAAILRWRVARFGPRRRWRISAEAAPSQRRMAVRGVSRSSAATSVSGSISTAICVHTARHSMAARSLSMR